MSEKINDKVGEKEAKIPGPRVVQGSDPKKADILDDVKRSEAAVKKIMLIKMLTQIKEMAHNVLELKEKCNALLSEIGVSAEDTKRIIDFVNNLDTVQLNEGDKKEVRDWAKKQVQGERKDVVKKIEDKFPMGLGNIFDDFSHQVIGSNALGTTSKIYKMGDGGLVPFQTFTTGTPYPQDETIILCNNATGSELKVNL